MKQIHRIIAAESVPEILELEKEILKAEEGYEVVFKRYFLSEQVQMAELPAEPGAVSHICQPPLSGGTVGAWLWLADAQKITKTDRITIACDADEKHIWTAGIIADGQDSETQMSGIFRRYCDTLNVHGMSLNDNCIRTWIFVDDIDHNYAGAVKGRRDHFTAAGLTPQTHYIASTGIQGRPCTTGRTVHMDAYAVSSPGLRQQYLYAPTHLNPTYEYGVTFERGVRMQCPETVTTFISGTASIDNKGAVLHIGDIRMQTLRMWENVETLLAEAGNTWSDVKQILVYIRNASDYPAVAALFADRFPDTPYIILHAPVCRPDWLIEMECLA